MAPYNFASVDDYEKYALQVLPKNVADYYAGGAGHEFSLKLNTAAFQSYRIRPRMLVSLSNMDTSCTIMGHRLTMPLGISPSAMQKMAHPDGECGNARAAGAKGLIYILSTLSTTSIEDVAEGAPDTIKWFQLYIYSDREVTKGLVQRAEKAGFKAIVLTVDAPIFGTRYRDIKNTFSLPPHLRLANFQDEKATKLNTSVENASSLSVYIKSLLDPKLCWDDIRWLQSITNLPIVVKGILTAEDAIKAVSLRVKGIMVSNHGARQIDTCPATIEVLPEIAKAVGGKCDIYLDGGIRCGIDIFKAVALGAKMVFIGRPALWGLAHSGEEGVKKVLDILITEFKDSCALAGCPTVEDIRNNKVVVHKSYYSNL